MDRQKNPYSCVNASKHDLRCLDGDRKELRLSLANWVNGCEFHQRKRNNNKKHQKRNQCGEKMTRWL